MANYSKSAAVFKIEGSEYTREELEAMSLPELVDISERALFKASAIDAEIQQMTVHFQATGAYEDYPRMKHLLYGRSVMRSWLSALKHMRDRKQNNIYQFYLLCEKNLPKELFDELLREVETELEKNNGG